MKTTKPAKGGSGLAAFFNTKKLFFLRGFKTSKHLFSVNQPSIALLSAS